MQGTQVRSLVRTLTAHIQWGAAKTNKCVCALSCPTLCNSMTVARQAPLSMGFSRQKYWSGLLFPFPEDLPGPGIKSMSPALQEGSIWIVNKHMKIVSVLLFKEIWVKTTVRPLCTLIFMGSIKRLTISRCWRYKEKQNSHTLLVGMQSSKKLGNTGSWYS